MESNDRLAEQQVDYLIAKEFLQERLGVEPTSGNIRCFIHCLITFEKLITEHETNESL